MENFRMSKTIPCAANESKEAMGLIEALSKEGIVILYKSGEVNISSEQLYLF